MRSNARRTTTGRPAGPLYIPTALRSASGISYRFSRYSRLLQIARRPLYPKYFSQRTHVRARENISQKFDNCRRGRRRPLHVGVEWDEVGEAAGAPGSRVGPTARTSRLMNLRRGALSWTTEGINNAVKYFMDFVECGCGVRSRRTHLSRSGQLQSLMGTNGHRRLRAVVDDVACLCGAVLTARRSRIYTRYLQIPGENRAERARFASGVQAVP